jgi:hypothetical protein
MKNYFLALFITSLALGIAPKAIAKAPTVPLCSAETDSTCAPTDKPDEKSKTSEVKKISPGWHKVSIEESAKMAQDACLPDVKKFCKGVKNGNARIAHCLVSHVDKLNPECRSYVGQLSFPSASGQSTSGVPPLLAAPVKPFPPTSAPTTSLEHSAHE